jgi:hypothetical protein
VRIGRLDAHPRETGSLRIDGALPTCRLRYAEFLMNRLVLRPHNIAYPVELIELDPGQLPGDLIAGRVALIVNEL